VPEKKKYAIVLQQTDPKTKAMECSHRIYKKKTRIFVTIAMNWSSLT
jgi:hypothetical protein